MSEESDQARHRLSESDSLSASPEQPTSALAAVVPPTTSIMPPHPASIPGNFSPQLPDPGTDSVVPPQERDSQSSSGSASGSGALSGSIALSGSVSITSRRTSVRTSRRGRLGAGLVDVPRVPYRDPASAILVDPVVSENKRFCGHCGEKVGRAESGKPGSPEGICQNCATPFSFLPRLRPHEIVGGQYEVLGALAYGGLGWIYLAQDHNVSDRWVVLKGLIDTTDETAMTSAVNEQRFLAQVEHPNIVKIYNFVQHPDEKTGATVGYIVMEYVGGQSLRQLALAHHRKIGKAEPLPIGQVIAYGLEILPALGYLHGQGLLYCDLKPDNVIQTHEQLKLIDLGAVRRIDDYESPLFFTTGYSAPELVSHGASISSDLYTVGRTLAVLSFEFTGYTTKYHNSLPGPDTVRLFARFDSFYRFLKRATHPDPDRRFIAAEEMADQLTGVLREIMSQESGKPNPGMSTVFGPEIRAFGVHLTISDTGKPVSLPEIADIVAGLPVPQVDAEDAGAGVLATTTSAGPREAIEALRHAPTDSIEVRLRIVRARIELGELTEANRQLQAAQYLAIRAGYPHDWRLDWYHGLIELAAGRPRVAQVAFEAVYDDLPGELASILALAVSAEQVGDLPNAAKFYEIVWRTDHSYVSAAFGLARVFLGQNATGRAIEILETVPVSSSHHVAAQIAAITIKMQTVGRSTPGREDISVILQRDLSDAAKKLERLSLDVERHTRLSAEVLEAAYALVRAENLRADTIGNEFGKSATIQNRNITLLGCEFSERELRFGLERCYRGLARLTNNTTQRIELVDKANAIRPRTVT